MKASELSQDALGILLVGDPGSGKTHFISTMPKPLRVFVFDGKAAASTYAKASDADQIDLIFLDPTNEESVLTLEEEINRLAQFDAGNFPIRTAALDGLTTYGDAEMRRAMFTNKLGGKGGSRIGNIVPNQTDYLLQMARVKYILQKLLSLPCNVAVAAHEAIIEDKNGGLVGVVAHVSGKKTMAKNLPSMFGEAYHTEQAYDKEKGETIWRIRCRGSEELSWCFSKIGLPSVIEPNWQILEEYLK